MKRAFQVLCSFAFALAAAVSLQANIRSPGYYEGRVIGTSGINFISVNVSENGSVSGAARDIRGNTYSISGSAHSSSEVRGSITGSSSGTFKARLAGSGAIGDLTINRRTGRFVLRRVHRPTLHVEHGFAPHNLTGRVLNFTGGSPWSISLSSPTGGTVNDALGTANVTYAYNRTGASTGRLIVIFNDGFTETHDLTFLGPTGGVTGVGQNQTSFVIVH